MTSENAPESSETLERHEYWMGQAIEQARLAAACAEVPVGAVLVADGELLAAAHNQPIKSHDATAHAEILALRQGAKLRENYRLPGSTLYVTIEPCMMCVGALVHARVDLLVFGAREPRAGAVVSRQQFLDDSSLNHRVRYVEGILAQSCGQIMQEFFRARR